MAGSGPPGAWGLLDAEHEPGWHDDSQALAGRNAAPGHAGRDVATQRKPALAATAARGEGGLHSEASRESPLLQNGLCHGDSMAGMLESVAAAVAEATRTLDGSGHGDALSEAAASAAAAAAVAGLPGIGLLRHAGSAREAAVASIAEAPSDAAATAAAPPHTGPGSARSQCSGATSGPWAARRTTDQLLQAATGGADGKDPTGAAASSGGTRALSGAAWLSAAGSDAAAPTRMAFAPRPPSLPGLGPPNESRHAAPGSGGNSPSARAMQHSPPASLASVPKPSPSPSLPLSSLPAPATAPAPTTAPAPDRRAGVSPSAAAGRPRFDCDRCGRSFASSSYRNAHRLREHANGNAFACRHCNKQFSSRSNLNKHCRVVHSGAKNCACPVCGRMLSTSPYLVAHLRSAHGVRDPRFLCILCSAAFVSPAKLRRHQLTHHAEVRPQQTAMLDRATGSLLGQGLLPLDREQEAARHALRQAEHRRVAQEEKQSHREAGAGLAIPASQPCGAAEAAARAAAWTASALEQLAQQRVGPPLSLSLTTTLPQLPAAPIAGRQAPAGQAAEPSQGGRLRLGGQAEASGARGRDLPAPAEGRPGRGPAPSAATGSQSTAGPESAPNSADSGAAVRPATPALACMPPMAAMQRAPPGHLLLPGSTAAVQAWSGTTTSATSAALTAGNSTPSKGSDGQPAPQPSGRPGRTRC